MITTRSEPQAQRMKVLVVDDDEDTRETVKEILEDEGYPVAVAANGEEALTYLRHGEHPGLILLDVHMPVMGGGEFTDELKRDPNLRSIPTVVLTAAGKGNLEQDVTDGLQGMLRKPIRLDELLATVDRFCGVQ